jgi:hypothetical protein
MEALAHSFDIQSPTAAEKVPVGPRSGGKACRKVVGYWYPTQDPNVIGQQVVQNFVVRVFAQCPLLAKGRISLLVAILAVLNVYSVLFALFFW